MDAIAGAFGVSRPTVSRWLARAVDLGIVRVEIDESPTVTPAADRLAARFGVRVTVVPTRPTWTEVRRLDVTAREAAHVLVGLVDDDTTVGLAWGTTVSTLVSHLPRSPRRGVRIVQVNGAANAMTAGVPVATGLLTEAAAAFDATLHELAAPAFFDRATTREALWTESSVRRVLAVRASADVAVFGVGALAGTLRSQVYTGGYLTPADLVELRRAGAVGDICTHFLREDGTHADIALNARASGPSPAELARVPRRLCVVAGEHRVPALLGALRCGAVTDLVIDDRTADILLDRAR